MSAAPVPARPLRIHLRPLLAPGETAHVAVTTLAPGTPPTRLHDHDFHELFLVQRGVGTHLLGGNGGEPGPGAVTVESVPLRPGALVLIRPRDRHAFAGPSPAAVAAGGEGLRFLNVAFPNAWFTTLARLLPAGPRLEALRLGPRPPHVHADGAERLALEARGGELGVTPAPRDLELLRFGLEAFGLLLRLPWFDGTTRERGPGAVPPPCPGWLSACVARMEREPARPLADFQRFAGRSPEHFARASRRHYGAPPTELLHRARIRFVQRRLWQTEEKVLTLALEAGYGNLGHFQSTFRRLAGCTPRAWRARHAAAGGGGAVPR